MDEIRLGALAFWKPGWSYARKYPLRYGAFLCENCREEMGFEADSYIAIPCAKGEAPLTAIRRFVAHVAPIDAMAILARET
jgi:hypothetical protein